MKMAMATLITADPCPYSYGNSWMDQLACPDADQDGVSDINDPYPQSATATAGDWDGDGVLDHAFNQSLNVDRFPEDSTQWADSDNDGYGDNATGNDADAFPNEQSQWQDTDGDGFGDRPKRIQWRPLSFYCWKQHHAVLWLP